MCSHNFRNVSVQAGNPKRHVLVAYSTPGGVKYTIGVAYNLGLYFLLKRSSEFYGGINQTSCACCQFLFLVTPDSAVLQKPDDITVCTNDVIREKVGVEDSVHSLSLKIVFEKLT